MRVSLTGDVRRIHILGRPVPARRPNADIDSAAVLYIRLYDDHDRYFGLQRFVAHSGVRVAAVRVGGVGMRVGGRRLGNAQ